MIRIAYILLIIFAIMGSFSLAEEEVKVQMRLHQLNQ